MFLTLNDLLVEVRIKQIERNIFVDFKMKKNGLIWPNIIRLSLSLTMCHGLFLCRFQSVYKHYANYYLNSILSLNCFAGVFQCVCLSRAVCVCMSEFLSLHDFVCVGWLVFLSSINHLTRANTSNCCPYGLHEKIYTIYSILF